MGTTSTASEAAAYECLRERDDDRKKMQSTMHRSAKEACTQVSRTRRPFVYSPLCLRLQLSLVGPSDQVDEGFPGRQGGLWEALPLVSDCFRPSEHLRTCILPRQLPGPRE